MEIESKASEGGLSMSERLNKTLSLSFFETSKQAQAHSCTRVTGLTSAT